MVVKYSSGFSSALKAYHNQEHLLFQFLVTETILAHVQIQEMERILLSSNEIIDKNFLDDMIKPLLFLCGSGQNHMRLFGWGDDGILVKLRNYCIFFAEKNSSHLKREKLYQEADRLWLNTLSALDLMKVISQQTLDRIIDVNCFRPSILKINRAFKRFTNHIKRIFMQFRQDENILLFILRYREQLDDIYGERFVLTLLRKMFSKSLEKAQFFIEERYKARGFYHVLPLIQHHISVLK